MRTLGHLSEADPKTTKIDADCVRDHFADQKNYYYIVVGIIQYPMLNAVV